MERRGLEKSQAMNRREFLNYSGQLTLAAVIAMNFGCSVTRLVNDPSAKIVLIYGTRYGATSDTAGWIAQGMDNRVDLLNIESLSFSQTAGTYDRFIIGSGVWSDGVHKRLLEFLSSQKEAIGNKVVASFIVCGSDDSTEGGTKRIAQYFERFHSPLDYAPPIRQFFGGRMIIEQLTEQDRRLLENFYRNIVKKEFISWDRTQPEKATLFGSEVAAMSHRETVRRE